MKLSTIKPTCFLFLHPYITCASELCMRIAAHHIEPYRLAAETEKEKLFRHSVRHDVKSVNACYTALENAIVNAAVNGKPRVVPPEATQRVNFSRQCIGLS